MLTTLHTWPEFSNHTTKHGPISSSLESVHDTIHNATGSGGHMSSGEVAGMFRSSPDMEPHLKIFQVLTPSFISTIPMWTVSCPSGLL